MLLLCSCIVLYCSYACCMSLRMLFVLVLCIAFMHSGMEERLCRMPEFKQINQIKSNQPGPGLNGNINLPTNTHFII